ncbi:hypothetical protein [Kitasatospora sp. NPDC101183]|uniref:hypothetical protein n=1 Tax=Kitasatospora sp. NPDC101183 TaxID=3364100 RepID=UPI00381FF042
MTLVEHARAIEAAIRAAHADGFELDDGSSNPIRRLELNEVGNGTYETWISVDVPPPSV